VATALYNQEGAFMDSLHVAMKTLQEGSLQISQTLSLAIALLAVLFGPILAHLTAKRTVQLQLSSVREQIAAQVQIAGQDIRAEVLSGNRQRWINTLRDSISEFVSLAVILHTEKQNANDFLVTSQRFLQVRTQISLLINPKEDDHRELNDLLEQTVTSVLEPEKSKRQLPEVRPDIIIISQKILKREWERVKELK
jgi:hypothetical protein